MKLAVAPRKHWTMLLALMGIGLAALGSSTWVSVPIRIVYNPSDSVARGWYRIGPGPDANALQSPWRVGSIVMAQLPDSVAAFAAQRGYLPPGVPILKRIGAVSPQLVCIREQVVYVDGVSVVTTLVHDGTHRPLHPWAQCRALAEGELFLLSDTNPASFDSRYFGPIDASAVLGIARPMWTQSRP